MSQRTHPLPNRKGPARGKGRFGRPTYGQARRIIAKFGGEAALARALGISRITPYRWEYARPYGTDGLIPNAMVARVQAAAKAEGIELTPADWEPTLISYPTPLFPEYLS